MYNVDLKLTGPMRNRRRPKQAYIYIYTKHDFNKDGRKNGFVCFGPFNPYLAHLAAGFGSGDIKICHTKGWMLFRMRICCNFDDLMCSQQIRK